jgi:hypothetical protein
MVGNHLGCELKKFQKLNPLHRSSFMKSPGGLVDTIHLLSNKHSVLIFLLATTKGIYGTERSKDCHDVIFMVINDMKNRNWHMAWILSHLEKFINWPAKKQICNTYNPPYIATSSPGFMIKMHFAETHLYIVWEWNLTRLQSKRSIILWKYQFQQVIDQLNIMTTLIDEFNAKTLEFRNGLFKKNNRRSNQ